MDSESAAPLPTGILARLRSKLASAGAPIPANVRGVGYKLG